MYTRGYTPLTPPISWHLIGGEGSCILMNGIMIDIDYIVIDIDYIVIDIDYIVIDIDDVVIDIDNKLVKTHRRQTDFCYVR